RIVLEDCTENYRRGGAGEGKAAGGHLVQHGTEREQIATSVEAVFASCLFRRHVGYSTHFSLASQLGETEIENLYLTALSDEDVGRLDVTMNDALGMRGFERLGELNADIEQAIKRQGRTKQLVIKALAFEQFHRDERLAVRVFNRVDGTNIRVVQGRGGAGLEQKAVKHGGVPGHVRRKKLKRDTTTQSEVLRFVNHAHSAAPELAGDAVMRDGLPNHLCVWRGRAT